MRSSTQLTIISQTDYKIGDPILHIELRRWADIVLVAPCSANMLAKIANGICDNLAVWTFLDDIPLHNLPQCLVQTSLLRALAPTTPTYLFPAMNTFMYEHPLTNLHIRTIKDVIHYEVIGPIGKNLACGDTGTCLSILQACLLVSVFYIIYNRCWCHDRMER